MIRVKWIRKFFLICLFVATTLDSYANTDLFGCNRLFKQYWSCDIDLVGKMTYQYIMYVLYCILPFIAISLRAVLYLYNTEHIA